MGYQSPVAGGRDLDVRLYTPVPTVDTFTDDGQILSAHVGDPGWTWAKRAGYDTILISSGHVIGSDNTFPWGLFSVSATPASPDYSASGEIIPLAVDTGGVFPGGQWSAICVRMQPDGTCYAIALTGFAEGAPPEESRWVLGRWNGSEWVRLAVAQAVVAAGQPYPCTVTVSGNQISATIEGTTTGTIHLTATDSTIAAAGAAGLGMSSPDSSTGAAIDNFTCSYAGIYQAASTSINPTGIVSPEAAGVGQPGAATPGSITFSIPAGVYSGAALSKTSGANSVGGETDTFSAGTGSVDYVNPYGATFGYGFTDLAFTPAMIDDLNAHAGGSWTVTWAVSAGWSAASPSSFTLALTPAAIDMAWQRARLPDFELGSVDYEIVEKGGFGEGHVQVIADWEDYAFAGTERVDIWDGAGANLLYRGDLRLPESHLELTETKELALYGHAAACSDWQVGRRYCYATIVDLSQVATDLFTDIVGPNEATAISDIQSVGVNIQIGQEFDFTKSSLADAMDQLISLAPAQAIWGWDTAADPAGGRIPVNRFYLRPRASSAKYHYVVGDTVQALVDPKDTTQIVNQIAIDGGPALQPNLANNGGFEHPVAPDEHHGNLLLDGSFEQSTGHYSHDFLGIVTGWSSSSAAWSLSGNIVLHDSVHATAQEAAQDGGWFISIGPDIGSGAGTLEETIPVNYTAGGVTGVLRAGCWLRRATVTPDTPAAVDLYLDALDSGGTVLATAAHPLNPIDPHFLATFVADSLYQRVTWDADFTGVAGCTQVKFRAVGATGSNNLIDCCGVWYRDRPVQQAWLQTQSGPNSEPSGPASPPATVDWVHKATSSGDTTAPLQGGYCVKVTAAPASGSPPGWVELQQEVYAKAKGKRYTTYTVLAQFRTASGDATVTCGAYAYASDGTLWAVLEGDQFVGGSDGNWHSLYCTVLVQDADVDLQPFLRVYSTSTVYFDSVMLVEGGPPAECLEPPAGDQNWWEGANYQWSVRSDNSSLGLTGDPASSITTYGVRGKSVDQPLVIDRISAEAYAKGYFQTNAIPRRQVRLTAANALTDATGNTPGLDGQVKVHGLPGEAAGGPPNDTELTPVRIRWQYRAEGVTCDIDLNNERSTMALLFLEERANQNSQAAAVRASQSSSGSSGNSGSGPYNNPGASSASGMAALTNVAHLTGDPQRISAQTVFQPTTDLVGLATQREAAGQTNPLFGVYDETGAELGAWEPDGSILATALKVSGLTGATAASRYCGATASGAPASGTFAVGDYVIDQTGTIWICTVAGSPGTWASPAGGGVTSVGLSMPSDFTVTGSPVTGAGTLAVAANNQNANLVKAGPASGSAAAPTYRALVAADLPVMGASGASHAAGAVPDPGSTAGTTHYLREDGTWAVPAGGSSGLTPIHLPFDLSEGVPSLAGLTQVNISGAGSVVENAGVALSVLDSGSGAVVQLRGLAQAVPGATPYRVAWYILMDVAGKFNPPQFGWYDSSTGKLDCLAILNNGSGGNTLEHDTWNSATSRAAATALNSDFDVPTGSPGIWVAVRDDGTNVYWEISATGAEWVPVLYYAKTAGFMPSASYGVKVFCGWMPYSDAGISPARQGAMNILCWDTGAISGRSAGYAPVLGSGSLIPSQLPGYVSTRVVSATTDTLQLSDAGNRVRYTSASPVTVTVPTNASVAFTTGTVIELNQGGAGQVTLSPAAGVTVNDPDGHTKTAKQYASISLIYEGADTWTLGGYSA